MWAELNTEMQNQHHLSDSKHCYSYTICTMPMSWGVSMWNPIFQSPFDTSVFFAQTFFCGPFMHIINATRLLLMQNRFFPPRAVVSTFFSAILQTAHNRFRTVVTIPFSEYFIWDGYQWMSDDYFDWKSCIIFCCCILFARCADNIIELCVLRFYHSHANFTLWLAWMWR